jgi:hypothetical protein
MHGRPVVVRLPGKLADLVDLADTVFVVHRSSLFT